MNPHESIEGYDMSRFSQPPQIFGAQDADGNPIPAAMPSDSFFVDQGDQNGDENDPKRRRIARVSRNPVVSCDAGTDNHTGLRHVPQEEDQV